MDEIKIGDPGAARGGHLVFEGPPVAGHIDVRLEARYVQARDTIELDQSLPAFFTELAQNRRGWQGEATWQSAFSDLTLEARHDGVGHVLIVATLRDVSDRHVIEASGQSTASAGVQLEPAALPAVASSLSAWLHDYPD